MMLPQKTRRFLAVLAACGLGAVVWAPLGHAAPPAPTDLALQASDTAITATWKGKAGSAYQLRSRPKGGSWNYDSVGRVTSHRITRLTTGTVYEVQVRVKARSKDDTSSYTPRVTVTTGGPRGPVTTEPKLPGKTTSPSAPAAPSGSASVLAGTKNVPASGFAANGVRTNGHATVLKVKDAATRDVRMSNGTVTGADRVLDMVSNAGRLTDFSFQKVMATGLDRGFFRVRNASNGLVQDVVAVGGKTTDYYPTGFATSDLATKNLTFDRVIARGFKGKPGKSYTNGDGWAQEELSVNTVLRDCLAIDNADAGFDMKGEVTATRIAASGNYRNLRLWGSFDITDFTSINPKNAGIWLGGGNRLKGGTITRPTFVGNGSAPDIKIDSNSPAVTVTIIDPVTPGNRPLRIDKEGGAKVRLVIKYTGSKRGVVAKLPALPQVAGASRYGLGG